MAKGKWTTSRIRQCKGRHPLACLTAHDWGTARLLDDAGIPLILVGDSLAMTVLGYRNTLPVTLAEMLHHAAAVARGVTQAMVVADMPFLSYQGAVSEAVIHAGRFLKEAGVDAVKIEGGATRAALVKALVENGIPVLGHIGLMPQSLQAMGGYKVQGRTAEGMDRLLADAQALDEAGVFAMVLECLPPSAGERITAAVRVPTIGIGAGPRCDGQILVLHDLLGLTGDSTPKFAKRYGDLGTAIRTAVAGYRDDVERGSFPGPEHCYSES